MYVDREESAEGTLHEHLIEEIRTWIWLQYIIPTHGCFLSALSSVELMIWIDLSCEKKCHSSFILGNTLFLSSVKLSLDEIYLLV